MNDKVIGAIDKILGLNSTAIVALGGLILSILYAVILAAVAMAVALLGGSLLIGHVPALMGH